MIKAILLLFITHAAIAGDHQHHHGHSHQKAHTHGEGKVEIVIEDNIIYVLAKLPAHDVLGFEHKAKSDKDKNTLKQAKALLTSHDGLIQASDLKDCTHKNKPKFHFHTHGHHGDIKVNHIFKCKNTSAIKHISLTLFKHLPQLQKVRVEAITDKGPMTNHLSPSNYKFSLAK